jgi:hypothetical protein
LISHTAWQVGTEAGSAMSSSSSSVLLAFLSDASDLPSKIKSHLHPGIFF